MAKKSEDEIIVFEKEFTSRSGRPRAFKSEEEFQETIFKYFTMCDQNRRMPSKAGFCPFANISRETYYKQKEYYPETFEIAENLFVDGLLNTPKNIPLAIMELANSFNYSRTDRPNELADPFALLEMDEEEIEKRLTKASIELKEAEELKNIEG